VTTFHTAPLGSDPAAGRFSLPETVRSWGRRMAWHRHVSRRFMAGLPAAAAVAHTPTTRRALIRRGLPARSVHIIPHGCLPQRTLRLDHLSAKARLGLPRSTVVLTMFGFVGGYKGHDLAVRALAKLPPRFHLAICGGTHPESDDRALATVIRLVRKLGLEQRVTITGWLSEKEAEIHYAATDICLSPYVDAALSASGAITWALASGKPTIASKIPAFQEICREQPCLLLTTPGMVEEIVWAVEKLAGDGPLAERLVAAAGRYIAAHSWAATAAATRDLYAALLAGAAPAATGIGPSRIVNRPDPTRMDQLPAAVRAPRAAPGRRRAAG